MIYPDVKFFSHSALQMFETCPHKYYRVKVLKDIKETFNDAAKAGLVDHKSLENYLKTQADLPSHLQKVKPICDIILKYLQSPFNYVLQPESQFALSRKMQSCGWFQKGDNAAFWRAVLDVLLLNSTMTEAMVIDWKTGREKFDQDQLATNAIFLFLYYPYLQKVITKYYWIKPAKFTPEQAGEGIYFREDLYELIQEQMKRVAVVQRAYDTGLWKCNVSGLCKNYCAVSQAGSCPDYPRRN